MKTSEPRAYFHKRQKPRKRLWMYSLEPKISQEIHRIQMSHVESVALIERN
ncbi:MAG TPA: hypothetical protein OIM34_07790 [Ruminococcus bromii]|nr:hypothetical protein [Ruminococcus bromii]